MSLAPGTRLGPYQIERALGAGGMGEVYKARDTRLHRAVAIKILHEPAGADATRKILTEARAAARLNHPNIATLHDVVEQDGVSFLVMEFVDGESLVATTAAGPCAIDRALEIVIQLADALAYAHAEGVVHRDVKPGNVVLTRGGQVKLLDLGIAQAAASDPSEATRTSTDQHEVPRRLGTPAYMAPELIAGRPASARSDIYSTGVLLFELLTGKRPFNAPDLLGFAMAMVDGPPPRVSTSRPDVPSELDSIVARAVARDPAARYQNAGALRDDLIRVRDRVRSGTVAPVPASARWWTRRRAILATAVAAVALLAWGASRWFAPGGPGSIAILPALNASEDAGLEAVGATVVSMLAGNLIMTPGASLVSSNPGAYRRQDRDVRKALTDLGVRYLLDVRVQKAGAGVGLDAQLLEAQREPPLWRNRYEGDALDVVRRVTVDVAGKLESLGAFTSQLSRADRDILRRVPTENPAAFAAYLRGRVMLDTGPRADAPKAATVFAEATALDPSFAIAFAALSHARTVASALATDRKSWTDAAAAASKRALDLDPGLAMVQEAAARVEHAAGQYERAERHAREAVRLAPDADGPRRFLASILWARHDRKRAIEEASAAVRLRPDLAAAQYALGYYYSEAGQYRDAIPPLVRATELQPVNPANFTILGAAYHKAGDVQQAIGHYAQALRLAPDAQAHSNLGTAYYFNEQFAEAADSYRSAIALDATSGTSYRNLADTYLRQNRPADARREYETAIARTDVRLKSKSQDVGLIALKAFCEAKLGRLDDAQRNIAAALTLSKRTSADTLFKSAQINTIAGRADQALRDLEEALSLGYPGTFARDDWELRSLRQIPKFTQLVNGPQK